MKIKENFVFQEIAGDYIVVPIANEASQLNGVIKLNETGAFVWKALMLKECTKEELVNLITEEFHVKAELAGEDIDIFLNTLGRFGCLE